MITRTFLIENKSSAPITVKGRTSFKVHGHAMGASAVEVVLPDDQQTTRLISRLKREYPALDITEKKAMTILPPPAATAEIVAPVPMNRELFVSKVTATTKKDAGWWHVSVDGFADSFKVRGAKDEAQANEMAYESYLETVTSPKGE